MIERIPFSEAITEPLLFKKQFSNLTPGIQAILKCIYGLPLTATEKAYWDAYHGAGKFDELGYLIDAWDSGVPYHEGQEMSDITLIVGRRSTKTSGVSSFIVAYEALLGAHKQFVHFERQSPVFLQVAQDLKTAQANLTQFIRDLLEQSPIGARELEGKVHNEFGAKKAVTATSLRLKNGALITVGPPTLKLRSQAIPVCAMDELAFWAKDAQSAQPDFEVVRAVTPAMASFPFSKLVKTSTPMTEEGVLWEAHNTGTYGRKLRDSDQKRAHTRTLVLKGPSAALAPAKVLPRSRLIVERAKDADAFRREYLAEFSKSVSGFLSASLLRAAVDDGLLLREPMPGRLYVATLDPAFRRDAFAFCIGHLEGGKYTLDFIESWRGTQERPISPTVAIGAVATVCKQYGVRIVTTDQYHSESLQEIAHDFGLVADPCYLNNKIKLQMWSSVQGMLSAGQIRLLDKPDLLDELVKMEKTLTPTGTVKFEGRHRDDLAMVFALNLYRALQYGERGAVPVAPPKPLSSQVRERVVARARFGERSSDWYLQ